MPTDWTVLDSFTPVGLEQMEAVKLMNRTDTKYLTDTGTLRQVLADAAGCGYAVLELSGQHLHGYSSMYYDTPELQMYLDHHNRRLVRQKLRTRRYETTGETFLELKSKNNHGRTRKKRLQVSPDQYLMSTLQDPTLAAWMEERLVYPRITLSPALETCFSRITLVNHGLTERSTMDIGLRFHNPRRHTSADLGPLAIIEVKQDGNLPSLLREILLNHRVKPVRISKYCIGTALTDNEVRAGRFKHKLMLINKLMDNA